MNTSLVSLFFLVAAQQSMPVDLECLEEKIGFPEKCVSEIPPAFSVPSYMPFMYRCTSTEGDRQQETVRYCACVVSHAPFYNLSMEDLHAILDRGRPSGEVEISLIDYVCPAYERLLNRMEDIGRKEALEEQERKQKRDNRQNSLPKKKERKK